MRVSHSTLAFFISLLSCPREGKALEGRRLDPSHPWCLAQGPTELNALAPLVGFSLSDHTGGRPGPLAQACFPPSSSVDLSPPQGSRKRARYLWTLRWDSQSFARTQEEGERRREREVSTGQAASTLRTEQVHLDHVGLGKVPAGPGSSQ